MKFTTGALHEQLQQRISCNFCKLPCVKGQGICYHCIHTPEGKALRATAVSRQFSAHWKNATKADLARKERNRKATSLRKYGTEHPMQTEEVKDRQRAVIQERYGVDAPMQSLEVQATLRRNLKREHGVVNVSQLDTVKAKKQQTCLKNHGVLYPMQSRAALEKRVRTYRNTYGVDHPSQNEEVFLRTQRNGFRTRYVTDPWTGEQHALRGYEPYAYLLLRSLYKKHLRPNPRGSNLWYRHNGKLRRYFPDFAVDRRDGTPMFFEVKSIWTLENKLKINKKKAAAGNVRFLIVDPRPAKKYFNYLLLPNGWEGLARSELDNLLAPANFKSFHWKGDL